MTTPEQHRVTEDRHTTTRDDTATVGRGDPTNQIPFDWIPEWAPTGPLPSSETLLAAFAGARTDGARDILDPAFDLVASARQQRLAEVILTDGQYPLPLLRAAGHSLVASRTDIAALANGINAAVCQRIPRRSSEAGAQVVRHTESVGEVVARMAELWEMLESALPDLDDHPQVAVLAAICDGYDALAADIAAGRRVPLGM
ncbi:hypothetical protein [Nocardia brasiliensis]|uniref:hypothetical protein n=1 Tax=Nocardia brasiliensis TaxID=37326 RepID=UPI00245407C4|nr:hypothetical protein [Nocardia brasiliensis]